MIDGQIKGIWRRTIKKEKVNLEVEFFDNHKTPINRMLEAAVPFGNFIDKKVEITGTKIVS